MPRKSRKQPGTSGGAYANRTDKSQAVALPTGLPYGERQQLEQAQQAAPVPQAAGTPMEDPAMAAAAAHNFQPVPLNAPSNRPFEPITHGLPSGPGAGPEILSNSGGVANTLARLAASTGNSAIQEMANRAKQFNV